jgi:hypothetical protein
VYAHSPLLLTLSHPQRSPSCTCQQIPQVSRGTYVRSGTAATMVWRERKGASGARKRWKERTTADSDQALDRAR